MSADETYNGWTNRETWAAALHINNDQGWQESVHDAIRTKLTDEGDDYSFGDVDDSLRARWAGEAIKDNVEELFDPEDFSSGEYTERLAQVIRIMSDVGSMWRVNWTELGASFLEDIEE